MASRAFHKIANSVCEFVANSVCKFPESRVGSAFAASAILWTFFSRNSFGVEGCFASPSPTSHGGDAGRRSLSLRGMVTCRTFSQWVRPAGCDGMYDAGSIDRPEPVHVAGSYDGGG